MVGGILGIILVLAAIGLLSGGPKGAEKVLKWTLAGPWTLFWRVLGGLLGVAGQGTKQVVRDAHRYGMRHHPATTLKIYGWVAAGIAGLGILYLIF